MRRTILMIVTYLALLPALGAAIVFLQATGYNAPAAGIGVPQDTGETGPHRATTGAGAIPLEPAYLTLTGHVRVSNSQGETANLTVNENITVSDASQPLPVANLTVNENIVVSDAPRLLSPVYLTVNENITVSDVPQALQTQLAGDANGDNEVDALDITKVERIIAGLDAPSGGADANGDGKVNALDITRVERIIAGLD
ncbi:MAG: hypothetical protein HYX91_01420 [Chloroflexi bacterium]|nr:hypothetical protein [Chloroflexota bacterium]